MSYKKDTVGDQASNKTPEEEGNLSVIEDLTGRDRIAQNVLFSWGGYLVFIVAGFVMPRLIDHYVGQVSLGVWDFSWSFVNYLNLAGLGVGSSVNRYVAKYRAANEVNELRKAVSSVVVIQLIIAFVVLLISIGLAWILPVFFSDSLGSEIEVARWVVGLLGSSLAIQMAFDTSRGVMTGCHRWGIYNAIHASSHAVIVVVMIIALVFGGGLISLSLVYLIIVAITEVVRMILAHRVCPELRIRLAYAEWSQAKKMLSFGGKTFVFGISPLVLVQTTNVLIVGALGPAMLAVFSRPIALVQHVRTIIRKFSFVLTPMAGSLQGSGQSAELRQFCIDSTRYGVAFTLPLVLFLGIFGDVILNLWMGPNYANWPLIAILAAGYFLPVAQDSVMRILMGMNLHGRIAFVSLVIILVGLALGIVIINALGWNLVNAALLVVLPLTIANGIAMPIFACRQLGIPLTKYYSGAFIIPSLCGSVFASWLIISRALMPDNLLAALAVGSTGGALLLGALYWRFMLPERLRGKNLRLIMQDLRIG